MDSVKRLVNLRIDDGVLEAFDAWAKTQGWSRTRAVERLMTDAVEMPATRKERRHDVAPRTGTPGPVSAAKQPCTCPKGPTKSLTVSGLCTACHGWFR